MQKQLVMQRRLCHGHIHARLSRIKIINRITYDTDSRIISPCGFLPKELHHQLLGAMYYTTLFKEKPIIYMGAHPVTRHHSQQSHTLYGFHRHVHHTTPSEIHNTYGHSPDYP